MSDVISDTGTDVEPPAHVFEAPADAPQNASVSEAARLLASLRKKRDEQPAEPAAAPVEAAAPEQPQESTAQTEDASPEQVPGETQAQPEADTLPPIEPPRSWKADEKERFKSLPRETQEYLAERETERDRALNRSQNEAAEKLKGLTVKEQAAEQARQQYESALPQLLQTLQTAQTGEFSDIRTIQDVERLAREDWPRYLQWDVAQKKIAAVQQELQSANQRQAQEKQQQYAEFANKQDALLKDRVPELADAAKADKLQKQAMNVLSDLGFTDTELRKAWNGEEHIPFRDYRIQSLIIDAIKYREAQANLKKVVAKPVPPVQRPGVPAVRGSAQDAEIKSLEQRLEQTGNAKDAARLVQLRRRMAG